MRVRSGGETGKKGKGVNYSTQVIYTTKSQ
jgi:hypothetical protein